MQETVKGVKVNSETRIISENMKYKNLESVKIIKEKEAQEEKCKKKGEKS